MLPPRRPRLGKTSMHGVAIMATLCRSLPLEATRRSPRCWWRRVQMSMHRAAGLASVATPIGIPVGSMRRKSQVRGRRNGRHANCHGVAPCPLGPIGGAGVRNMWG